MASQGNTEKRVENSSSTISYSGPSSSTPHPSIESDSYESKQGNLITGYPESTTLTARSSSAEGEEDQVRPPSLKLSSVFANLFQRREPIQPSRAEVLPALDAGKKPR